MIRMLIQRKQSSFDFKINPSKPDGFDNNSKHNSEDTLLLLEDDTVLLRLKCQSVANYCFGKQLPGDTVSYGDTIADGLFTLKLFVPPRNFHGEIHAITDTTDLDGQRIDRNAMQTTAGGFQNGRWLIHDRFSPKLGKDTTYAWSAGCIILSGKDLKELNKTLRKLKFKSGDTISGCIETVL